MAKPREIPIKGIQKLTLIDYPGKVACTIFTFGCNFRCPFCFNSSLVIDDSTPAIPEKEVFKFLRERKVFLEGVCVSGGEPTLHEQLPNFIKRIKELGYPVKLDTNGTNPKMLRSLVEDRLIDYVAMDIKAPWEKYAKVVGVSMNLSLLKESFKLIIDSGIGHEVRTTVVPTIHVKEDIVAIAKAIKGAKRYFLQQFRPIKTLSPKFMKVKPYTEGYLLELRDECNKYVPTELRI